MADALPAPELPVMPAREPEVVLGAASTSGSVDAPRDPGAVPGGQQPSDAARAGVTGTGAGSGPSTSTGSPAIAPPARPVNPYLNNSPEQRARRLARALVSDLVAYNPQKREEGLRDGTLRQLFREEIRKSWDEYVEQVGATVAESTPHFQDALNDVLAGGRRLF